MSTSVKIRKLSKSTVSNLNQLAKSNGMSRNELLKRAVEKLVEDEDSDKDEKHTQINDKDKALVFLNSKNINDYLAYKDKVEKQIMLNKF